MVYVRASYELCGFLRSLRRGCFGSLIYFKFFYIMIQTFVHPRSCRFSSDFALNVNGCPVEVLRTDVADFAIFVYDATQGPAEIEVSLLDRSIQEHVIRPLSLELEGSVNEVGQLVFQMVAAHKVSVEIEGCRPLYVWANPPELNIPSEDDPNVLYFKSGQTYEVGRLRMESGQTLYIEGGAVLKGRVCAKDAHDITIRGLGILDGSYYGAQHGENAKSIFFERCQDVLVRDITMIHPSAWMIVPGACERVEICNVKQIGEVMCSDGIDIVGSKQVHVHDCFLRNNDDCVVVKAFLIHHDVHADFSADFRVSPEAILVENCTFANDPAGNAMEIGHELSVQRVSGVTFRNIDVLSVHGQGAVFSIHNNDRAIVEDILFEDIRIEHCWDKFIDFRISKSRFSSDTERGHIRNVTLRDINWLKSSNNDGYTISLIGGWDAEHRVENVTLENICFNGVPIQHIDELEINTRHADDVCLVEPAVATVS